MSDMGGDPGEDVSDILRLDVSDGEEDTPSPRTGEVSVEAADRELLESLDPADAVVRRRVMTTVLRSLNTRGRV